VVARLDGRAVQGLALRLQLLARDKRLLRLARAAEWREQIEKLT
jgi:hypothetical protein